MEGLNVDVDVEARINSFNEHLSFNAIVWKDSEAINVKLSFQNPLSTEIMLGQKKWFQSCPLKLRCCEKATKY